MRIRFTIRELLLLTLVVAVSLGWWMDHHQHLLPPIETLVENYNSVLEREDHERDMIEEYCWNAQVLKS